MVGFLALLFALAAFTGTVVGINLWFGPENVPYSYDIMAALNEISQYIATLTEAPNEANLALGILALIIPSSIVFQMVRGAFGGK